MSEVSRQVGQEPLDVLAFAVPGNEANDCESVPEIVQSRLVPGILRTIDACLLTKALEDEFCRAAREGIALAVS
jgi:hypothetical protein